MSTNQRGMNKCKRMSEKCQKDVKELSKLCQEDVK